MNRDILIHYCGPYSIQTTDVTISSPAIENTNIFVERGQLREEERLVEKKLKPERR